MDKLLIYNFYNGYTERPASMCNLYNVLRLLALCDYTKEESMCWVRDYVGGLTITTQTQLDTILLNNPKRLRISFFSKPIANIKQLALMAKTADFPSVFNDAPTGMDVFTIWFYGDTMRVNRSGIENIEFLFTNVRSAYAAHYANVPKHDDNDDNESIDDIIEKSIRTMPKTTFDSFSKRSSNAALK